MRKTSGFFLILIVFLGFLSVLVHQVYGDTEPFYAGEGSDAEILGAPDLSYASIGKGGTCQVTGYESGSGTISEVYFNITYYGDVSGTLEWNYQLDGGGYTKIEDLPEGGSSGSPLTRTYDASALRGSWTWSNLNDTDVQFFNNDGAGPETSYVDAIYVTVVYTPAEQQNIIEDLPETCAVTASLETQKAIHTVSSESITVTSGFSTQRTLHITEGASTSVTSTFETDKGITEVLTELSETVAGSSSLIIVKALTRSFSEVATVASTFESFKGIFAIISESVAVSVSTLFLKTLTSILGESFSVTSVLESNKGISQVLTELSETVSSSATLLLQKAMHIALSEPYVISSVLQATRGIIAVFEELSETVASSASLLSTKGIFVVLSETATISSMLDTTWHIVATFLEFAETFPVTAILTTILPEIIEDYGEIALGIAAIAFILALCGVALAVQKRKQEE